MTDECNKSGDERDTYLLNLVVNFVGAVIDSQSLLLQTG